jgi:hypothetical protein
VQYNRSLHDSDAALVCVPSPSAVLNATEACVKCVIWEMNGHQGVLNRGRSYAQSVSVAKEIKSAESIREYTGQLS